MIAAGDINEVRVNIDATDAVAALQELATDPSGPAAGVKDRCTAWRHRIDKAGFPIEILALCAQGHPAGGVVRRVAGVGGEDLCPGAGGR